MIVKIELDIHSPISLVITLEPELVKNISDYESILIPYSRITYQFYETNDTYYPIIALRNIAINNTKTSHFFVCDMDFWPSCISLSSKLISSWIIWDHHYSTRLHNERWLARYYCSWIWVFEEERRMFFISELCWTVCLKSWVLWLRIIPSIPQTKNDLKKCIIAKNCTTFKPSLPVHVWLKISYI